MDNSACEKRSMKSFYPTRVIVSETGKRSYLGFRFSTGWYAGFRRRYVYL